MPGVGSFGFAMKNIKKKNLQEKINSYANSGRPILGTCLGMQLLLSSSEEFGNFKGLGLIKGKVRTLKNLNNNQNQIKLPNIGWQKLKFDNNNKLLLDIDSKMNFIMCTLIIVKLKIIQKFFLSENLKIIFFQILYAKNIFGVQFHPEKAENQV